MKSWSKCHYSKKLPQLFKIPGCAFEHWPTTNSIYVSIIISNYFAKASTGSVINVTSVYQKWHVEVLNELPPVHVPPTWHLLDIRDYNLLIYWWCNIRNSRPEVFLGQGVLKICSKFTGEHPCRSVNLLHISRTLFPKNTSGGLLL